MPMHASSRPRGRGKPHLLIVIEGGGVKEVISDTEGVTYDTLDWDNVREGEGVWEFLPLYVEPPWCHPLRRIWPSRSGSPWWQVRKERRYEP